MMKFTGEAFVQGTCQDCGAVTEECIQVQFLDGSLNAVYCKTDFFRVLKLRAKNAKRAKTSNGEAGGGSAPSEPVGNLPASEAEKDGTPSFGKGNAARKSSPA